MKIQHILSALIFVFALCLFGSNAFAQAADEGFDLRVGIAGDILRIKQEVSLGGFLGAESDDTIDYNGLAGKISFGYRWEFGGIYIDQDLGGVWYGGDNEGDDNGHFVGGTFLVGRGIYPITDQFMIDLGFGIGVMYAAGDSMNDYDGDYEDFVAPLIMNEDGDPSAAFAIKISFSLAYFFTDMIGAGIYVDYSYAIKTISQEGIDFTTKYHFINPGLQFVARF